SDTSELVAAAFLSAGRQSPGLFSVSQDGKGQALALGADGKPNATGNMVTKGSILKFFGTGQGPLDQTLQDGVAAPGSVNSTASPTTDGSKCLTVQSTMCFAVGSTFGEIVFSGLAPGTVGVWEIDVKIPTGALSGPAVPVRAVVNGTLSNLVTIAIK